MNLPISYLHQHWQNQILDQLGIVRWVDFHTAVIELDINELEKSLVFSPPIIHDIDIKITSVLETQDNIDEPIYLDKLNNTPAAETLTVPDTEVAFTENLENTAVVIDKFHLQILVFQDWIILADLAVLREDGQQQLLWQNLSCYLHLTPDDFIFPIVTQNNGYYLNHKNQQMCTDLLALALFDGKICALNQDKIHQIGCVTPLPEVFNNKAIYPLPYLQSMLNDFEQKRLFWHTLKGIH